MNFQSFGETTKNCKRFRIYRSWLMRIWNQQAPSDFTEVVKLPSEMFKPINADKNGRLLNDIWKAKTTGDSLISASSFLSVGIFMIFSRIRQLSGFLAKTSRYENMKATQGTIKIKMGLHCVLPLSWCLTARFLNQLNHRTSPRHARYFPSQSFAIAVILFP